MPSIITGYEYDIFISYRQKDNKGDRWVSEFVEALKTELESTFKEEISVYFDINPHDGLLETHDVDASLKDKLKCLVFIPIISRTYCDPKSFAWEHEFKAFVEQASQDQFGLKVKLPNGNVANRVLPIRIHDLDNEDIKLCESITGGFLRGVEFIYKEAGVNRPLRLKEDSPGNNLNKTFYRNQINKVANAIKDIILGLNAKPTTISIKEDAERRKSLEEVLIKDKHPEKEKPAYVNERKLLSGVAVLAILILAAILAYPKIFKRNTLEKLRSSGEGIIVAVMPFQNMTRDTTKNFWQEMIQDNLITSLSNSEELKVRQTESIITLLQNNDLTNYASITPSIARSVSQKLDANVFVHGSINQIGTIIRLNAKLIDSESDEVFKSFQIDGTAENILHLTDSLSVLVKNFLIISALGKEITPDFQHLASTNFPEAYKNFIYGQKAFSKLDFPMAIKFYSQAIAIDSNYAYPTIAIFWAYQNQSLLEESKKWCLKAYEKKDLMSMPQKSLASSIYALCYETPYEVIKYLKQTLEFDDQLPDVYTDIGTFYNTLYQYDKAIPVLEKALEIYYKWDVKPFWSTNYVSLGIAYHKTGQYKKEKKLYKKAEQDFPDDLILMRRQFILAIAEGDSVTAKNLEEKAISIFRSNSMSEADIITSMASVYSDADMKYKAEEYYRQALSLEPENPTRLVNLAYFLIDEDQNISEGLQLVDTALKLIPDNYIFLHTKGWGLFKQGKYNEALDLLQQSWDLRRQYAVYNHEAYLHLEEAKKAVANQKNN